MSKSFKKLAFGILLVASLSLMVLAADISGAWEITIQSSQGEMAFDMSIEQDGENITVTMEGFQGEEMVGEGTFKDNKAEMGDYGSMEWTAKKK